MLQPIDKSLVEKIHTLVGDGVKTVDEMKIITCDIMSRMTYLLVRILHQSQTGLSSQGFGYKKSHVQGNC